MCATAALWSCHGRRAARRKAAQSVERKTVKRAEIARRMRKKRAAAVGALWGEQGQPQKQREGGKYLQELYYAGKVLSTVRAGHTGRANGGNAR